MWRHPPFPLLSIRSTGAASLYEGQRLRNRFVSLSCIYLSCMSPSLHARDAKVRNQALSLYQHLVCSVFISLCAATSDTTCFVFFFLGVKNTYLWSPVFTADTSHCGSNLALPASANCWVPFYGLDGDGYNHQTINTISFID